MNREIFSTEIVRTMVGSIGLVIATPITTMVSMWVLTRKNNKKIDQSIIEEEKHALEHVGHGHSH